MKFSGSIRIGRATLLSPSGARGHRIILPVELAAEKIHTLIGQPLKLNHGGLEIGRITEAEVAGRWMSFRGELFKAIEQPEDLGFSWEIVEAHVENWAAKVWKIARFDQFTGMALTLKPASESSRLQIFEVNSNPTKEATPVADERDEYKRDQQYLAAEREDQQQRILRADAPSFTEDDDQDDEHDYDEGPAFTEQDDPEDKAPAERDAPLPTAAAEEPTIENGGLGEGLLQPTALAEEPAAGSAEGKLNRNMQNLAKAMDGLGPKRQRVKPKPKAKKAAKEKPKPKKPTKKGSAKKKSKKR